MENVKAPGTQTYFDTRRHTEDSKDKREGGKRGEGVEEKTRTHFLCWAEERRVQISATMTTTTTVTAPTDTMMITSRLLFFWGVTLPWGGLICPIGGPEKQTENTTG